MNVCALGLTSAAICLQSSLKGVSHENQEGSKAVSIKRSSFKDVSAGSFLYFQSGFFKSAKKIFSDI